MTLKYWLGCVFLVMGLSSGCAGFSPQKPDIPLDVSSSFLSSWNGTGALQAWWRSFHSDELNRLMDQALDRNMNVRSAWARLAQAQAVAEKTRAGLFPSLDLSGDVSRTRTYVHKELVSDSKSASLDLAASYELDLWGEIRSQEYADVASAQARAFDVQAAKVSLAGELSTAWIDLVALRQEIRLLQEQIETNTGVLRLQISRFENGADNALEVSQQQQTLAASRADLPALQAQEAVKLHQIALLAGTIDPDGLNIQTQTLPEPLPLPQVGLPARVLMARPDVQAAALRLRSAGWDVAQARAARLPRISLSTTAGLSSSTFNLVWGDWLTRLGANLSAPLFDAGLRRAEVQRALAVVDEQVAEYALTVLEAVQEVRNALTRERHQQETIQGLEKELQAARQARMQARLRYTNGQSGYVNVLLQQRSVQSLERQLLTARAELLLQRVALYRALGAGWENPEMGQENVSWRDPKQE